MPNAFDGEQAATMLWTINCDLLRLREHLSREGHAGQLFNTPPADLGPGEFTQHFSESFGGPFVLYFRDSADDAPVVDKFRFSFFGDLLGHEHECIVRRTSIRDWQASLMSEWAARPLGQAWAAPVTVLEPYAEADAAVPYWGYDDNTVDP